MPFIKDYENLILIQEGRRNVIYTAFRKKIGSSRSS